MEGKKGAQEELFGGILGVKIGTKTGPRDVFFENVIFHGMSIKPMVFDRFLKAKEHNILSKSGSKRLLNTYFFDLDF